MAELFVLCGPSCVGKSPLWSAARRIYPELCGGIEKIVLYTSRAPRPGETDGIDYHFRRRDFIESLADDKDFVVMDVRGDLQAINIEEIRSKSGKALYEGNPFVGEKLLEIDDCTGIFLSPLSREEIELFKGMGERIAVEEIIEEIMRKKLLRRAKRSRGILSLKDLEEVERRCRSAYNEMKLGYLFDYVIPNHDGEDSDDWSAFNYPLGDARRALLSFVDILEGRKPRFFERWDEDLLGP